MKNSNPHEGHRQRVRKEFLENGFSNATPPHKILELLLFYGIPRKDTNEIAHKLLDHFGSLAAVFEASPKDLMKIEGMGESSAVLINMLLPLFRIYESSKAIKGKNFHNMDDVCDFILKKYIGFKKEIFAVTTFNNRGEIIAFDTLNSGDNASVGVSTRSVIEKVIERNAVSVVISHNHPIGHALPSIDDIATTQRIQNVLQNMGIRLLDHIIVSNEDDDCISMAQTEDFQYIFK